MVNRPPNLPPLPSGPRPGGLPAPGSGGSGGGHSPVGELVTWIRSRPLSDHGNEELVRKGEVLGKYLAEIGLNTTQIRRILVRVNMLNLRLRDAAFPMDEVPLLKVQLAYSAARERQKVGPFAEVLLPAIDQIKTADDYRWFARFVEAVLAYHRYYDSAR